MFDTGKPERPHLAAPRSEALRELDLELLAGFVDRPTASQAIRESRAALAARTG